MLTAKAFQDTRHKLLTAKEQCGMKISYLQKINRACLYSYLIRYQIIRHVAFTKPFVPVFNHYIYRICYPVIVIKSHLVNVFNNNRPDSKQTLILPVHIKSQLSYAAITEKFCIRKLYNLWKNSKNARLKKSTRKMRMVSRSWQSCLEGPQNCPQPGDSWESPKVRLHQSQSTSV